MPSNIQNTRICRYTNYTVKTCTNTVNHSPVLLSAGQQRAGPSIIPKLPTLETGTQTGGFNLQWLSILSSYRDRECMLPPKLGSKRSLTNIHGCPCLYLWPMPGLKGSLLLATSCFLAFSFEVFSMFMLLSPCSAEGYVLHCIHLL